jgi:hypothetical protein
MAKRVWANPEYKKRMCSARKGRKTWNKGLKTGLVPKTAFKKGHPKPINGFKWGKREKAPNWQGGKMEHYNEAEKIRKSIEYRLWREAVFARDHWTCQKYKTIGHELIAHHVNNFADFPDLRLAIDNGITFSLTAHKEFHKIYGNKNNTKEQLKEFLKPKK